jgi:hypothetical protein
MKLAWSEDGYLTRIDDGKVAAANHRPTFWNGAWDYSTGASPDVDQSDDERAESVAGSHSRDGDGSSDEWPFY